MSEGYNSAMDYYAQPANKVRLYVELEYEEFKELYAYLEAQPVLESVSEIGYAYDSAPDPHAIAEFAKHRELTVQVAQHALKMVEHAATLAVSGLILSWVNNRNEKKKKEIEAEETQPLLYDHTGHTINIRAEKKRRK